MTKIREENTSREISKQTGISSKTGNNDSELQSLTINKNAREIENNEFKGILKLTFIEIPNRVEKIGAGAFWDCMSLASIEIPNSVKEIGNHAFGSCINLYKVTFEDISGITKIGCRTFQECKN